jgi:hypothetical protein
MAANTALVSIPRLRGDGLFETLGASRRAPQDDAEFI